jgi:hypothetical protein
VTESVQGPAFTRSARVLALIAMILTLRQAVQGLSQMDGPPEGTTLWVLVLGAVGLLYGLGHIWFTQTQVDQTHIRQSGWVRSEVEIARLTQVKLIYIPYLSWLIAPRLVVRSGGVRSWVFHAADPKVLQRFWQLAHDAQTLKPPPEPPSGS